MSDETKLKLLKFLFPREEIRKFMCDDFFMELSYLVPKSLCYSENNSPHYRRKANYEKIVEIIIKFLKDNPLYEKMILELYQKEKIEDIKNQIVIGFVFFIISSNDKWRGVDIFKNKKSVCYSPISIIDFIE